MYGRTIQPFDPVWFQGLLTQHSRVAVDLGTGDGRYVLDLAAGAPSMLCIGIDPVAEAMAKSSRVASARNDKGGCPNAVFLRSSLEQLPGPLVAVADELSVNYPWGSLLNSVALADHNGLALLRSVCKSGATVSIYLNYSVLEDAAYSERLGLGRAKELLDSDACERLFAAAGLLLCKRELFEGDPPFRTAWGRQLIRGSGRKSMILKAVIIENCVTHDSTSSLLADRSI